MLTVWVYQGTSETNTTYAWQEADLLDASGFVVANFYTTASNTHGWVQQSYDLVLPQSTQGVDTATRKQRGVGRGPPRAAAPGRRVVRVGGRIDHVLAPPVRPRLPGVVEVGRRVPAAGGRCRSGPT